MEIVKNAVVSGLSRHSLKGGAIERLDSASFTRQGMVGDRVMVVAGVNAEGTGLELVSQRKPGKEGLALIQSVLSPTGEVVLSWGTLNSDPIILDPCPLNSEKTAVKIHSRITVGIDAGEEVSAWLTDRLGTHNDKPLRLLRWPEEPAFASSIRYQDGHPLLITSHESFKTLAEKLRHLEPPLSASFSRFNIELRGLSPFEEDNIAFIRSVSLIIEGESLCQRCSVTTVIQEEGRKRLQNKGEPLVTLKSFRNGNTLGQSVPGVYYGLNASVINDGKLSVGEEVEVTIKSS